jgi:activating signal cointegrator complex subunit 3
VTFVRIDPGTSPNGRCRRCQRMPNADGESQLGSRQSYPPVDKDFAVRRSLRTIASCQALGQQPRERVLGCGNEMKSERHPRFSARSRGLNATSTRRRPRTSPPAVAECASALRRAVAAIAPGTPAAVDASSAQAYAAASVSGDDGIAAALQVPSLADRRVQAVGRCAAKLRAAAIDRSGYGLTARHVVEAAEWNAAASRAALDASWSQLDAGAGVSAAGTGESSVENDFWGSAALGVAPMTAKAETARRSAAEASPAWLRLLCESLAVVAAASGDGTSLTGAELAMTVLSMLQQESRSVEELQGELFDSFGGDFDAVGDVLSRRTEIVAQSDAVFADCAQAEELRSAGLLDSRSRAHAGAYSSGDHGRQVASVSSAFTVTDAREVALAKQRRKDEQRAIKAGLIPDWTAGDGPSGGGRDDEDSFLPKLGGSARDELQKAFPGVPLQGDTMIGGRDRVGLPSGASRIIGKGYEEVLVPPPSATMSSGGRKLVRVEDALSDYPELLPVLRGVETLNRLQSAVYPAAFRSSENLLVCAPTGAGKTNVALLTIMQELVAVKERRQADFKVVYVAPMKALAAEVVDKFGSRLRPLGLRVKEFTGDMSLTRRETLETHVLVTTPEKWDVVTRKSGSELSDAVTLFIIDEIHLLHDDRGSVLESIVARTLRLSEAAQRVIRLVGLSATLPNYVDVASFMRVNPSKGLFHFDGSHRPVPLSQSFVGITEGGNSNSMEARRRREAKMLDVAWAKVSDALKRGHQAMIFVHSRKATATTGRQIVETAAKEGLQALLLGASVEEARNAGTVEEPGSARTLPPWAAKEVSKSRTGDVRELCSKGIGLHHAGLPRTDRKLVERLFGEGAIRVLCCTATLAWGVNLPARAVVILGTDVYDAQKGGFVQLGMLDVMQIFGRAGRPQFDTEGEGTIITKHENLARYLNLLTSSIPIESTLGASASVLADHLNAEIVSGTVASVGDGVTWLSYTYLSVRMAQNPLVYGIGWDEVAADPGLHSRRATLIEQASRALDDARMCRYDPRTGSLAPTDLGRVSSHFYVSHRTVVLWNELLAKIADACNGMTEEAWEEMDATVLHAVSCASEFEQMRARQEEADELDSLASDACCVRLKASSDSREGKVNILLQSYISRATIRMSDLSYVVQSSTRLLRALFEVALRRGFPSFSLSALELARASESRVWPFQHPLWQFCHGPGVKSENALVPAEVVSRLEDAGPSAELESLRAMNREELTTLLRSPRNALSVERAVSAVPTLHISSATVAPITRTVLQMKVTLVPTFRWKDSVHGNAESWWLWVEDHEHERIYHSEKIMMTKRQVLNMSRPSNGTGGNDTETSNGLSVTLTVPVFDPPSSQYWVRVESERWHTGGGSSACLSLANLSLPQREPPHTELLDLRPLEVRRALKGKFAQLYATHFTHFNPVQTQVFHTAYHTDLNMLIGAPTGSGKTVLAEFAMLRSFEVAPGKCVVYIAPMKALVRERIRDWKERLSKVLGKRVVELTGDIGKVDGLILESADVIVATPEKWDVVSRGWQRRAFVRNVSLIVLDEVHLLGADRGPVLEAIVSRTRRLSLDTGEIASPSSGAAGAAGPGISCVRIVALSTAMSNARELADWIGASTSCGLFNFRPSVRPVPCEAHVVGVAGERYASRMQAMNRPTYTSIVRYSPSKPVLVFVSSRRQTRLTALDLVRLAAADGKPNRYLQGKSEGNARIADAVNQTSDSALKAMLTCGIGIHHAGLGEGDRGLVEGLFTAGCIQVLVSTSTLAWGVNLPAHLVVVKGTEYFDAAQQRYLDMPVTDILQMMGRAGRPQFDTQAFAVILVHEPKKTFMKKFLYEPFPVESSLHLDLANHLNAEVASGTVASVQDAMEYLTWTFLFRRMVMNPAFYGVSIQGESSAAARQKATSSALRETSGIVKACSGLVASCVAELVQSDCVTAIAPRDVLVSSSVLTSTPAAGKSTSGRTKSGLTVAHAGQEEAFASIRLSPTVLGRIASRYYLGHKTVIKIQNGIRSNMSFDQVLALLSRCVEFSELPVRMHEDELNAKYANDVAKRMVTAGHFKSSSEALQTMGLLSGFDLPSTKARLLVYGRLVRVAPPVVDYVGDIKMLLDQSDRMVHAAADVAAENGGLVTVLAIFELSQLLYQACMPPRNGLEALAGVDINEDLAAVSRKLNIHVLPDALATGSRLAPALVGSGIIPAVAERISGAAKQIPWVTVKAHLRPETKSVLVDIKAAGGCRGAAATSARTGRRREEGWILLISVKDSDQVLVTKRLPRFVKGSWSQLVPLPHDTSSGSESRDSLVVTVMSDVYANYCIKVEI